MSPEISPEQSPAIWLDFAEIRSRVKNQLAVITSPAGTELEALLETECQPYSAGYVADTVAVRLENYQRRIGIQKQHEAIKEVVTEFSDRDTTALESPRHYMKTHGIPNERRHALTLSREKVLAQSKIDLKQQLEDLVTDNYTLDMSINKDEVAEKVISMSDNSLSDINKTITVLHRYMNDKQARILLAYRKEMADEVLTKRGMTLEEYVMQHDNVIDFKTIHKIIDVLHKQIIEYQNPQLPIDDIFNDLQDFVSAQTKEIYTQRFRTIAEEIYADLPTKLGNAYERSSRTPLAVPLHSVVTVESDIDESVQSDEIIEKENYNVASKERYFRESMDTIKSPFSWTDRDIDVQLATDGVNNIVFSEAFSPAAERVRKSIMRDPQNRRHYDNMIDRFINIELSSPIAKDPHIDRVIGPYAEDYAAFTIYKFGEGGTGGPGRRVYYAKTNVSQFPEIAKLVAGFDLSPETQFLVYIGEANKSSQNQIALLRSFGISDSMLRSSL